MAKVTHGCRYCHSYIADVNDHFYGDLVDAKAILDLEVNKYQNFCIEICSPSDKATAIAEIYDDQETVKTYKLNWKYCPMCGAKLSKRRENDEKNA